MQRLLAILFSTATACANAASSTVVKPEKQMLVIHGFENGAAGVHANAAVKLTPAHDPELAEAVLLVDYPAPSDNPAARDVWCDTQNRNWAMGHAIAFRVKPANRLKLSVSFFDRNRVAYTAWVDLKPDEWQPVRIAFDAIRPNPYFQRPDAKTGAALDITDVTGIAFAPHDEAPGRFAISQLLLAE